VNRPTAVAVYGLCLVLLPVRLSKSGQAVVVVPAIPVATAVRFQSEAQVEITRFGLLPYVPVGLTQSVQEEHGLAIGPIPVMPVWDVVHT
jgi:hypothetical protein